MTRYGVTVRARLERFNDDQVRSILKGLPNAEFDRLRWEIVQTGIVESDTEEAARAKAKRAVSWVLDDAGLLFTDYTLEAHTTLLSG